MPHKGGAKSYKGSKGHKAKGRKGAKAGKKKGY